MFAAQDLARSLANLVQLKQRDHFFMRGYLKHAVRGGVYDGRSGSHMLLAQLLDDLGAGYVSYTHLRAHETPEHLVCRLLLEKKTHTTDLYTRPHTGSFRCVTGQGGVLKNGRPGAKRLPPQFPNDPGPE